MPMQIFVFHFNINSSLCEQKQIPREDVYLQLQSLLAPTDWIFQPESFSWRHPYISSEAAREDLGRVSASLDQFFLNVTPPEGEGIIQECFLGRYRYWLV